MSDKKWKFAVIMDVVKEIRESHGKNVVYPVARRSKGQDVRILVQSFKGEERQDAFMETGIIVLTEALGLHSYVNIDCINVLTGEMTEVGVPTLNIF